MRAQRTGLPESMAELWRIWRKERPKGEHNIAEIDTLKDASKALRSDGGTVEKHPTYPP